MRNQYHRTRVRNNHGQALMEAACGSVLMITLFVCLLAFAINIVFAFTYSAKLQIVANEAAKLVNNRTYWNGALRPDFQRNNTRRSQTAQMVKDYAAKLAQDLSLPSAPVVTIPDNPDTSANGVAYTKVTVSLPQVPLPYSFTQLFPNFLSISTVGIASEASEAPSGFIRLGYKLIDASSSVPSQTSKTQVCIIPCYGFQTDTNDGITGPNLGGTHNNDDVLGHQPDPNACVWNGLNVSSYKDEHGDVVPCLTGPPPYVATSTPVFN